MSVADNLASAVQLLRGSVVGSISVGERTGVQVLGLHRDREILLGGDRVTILGECDDRRDHVGLGGNVTWVRSSALQCPSSRRC